MTLQSITSVIVVCLGLSAASSAGAEQNWSGWDFVRSLPLGARERGVRQVGTPHPVRSGASSIRFEVQPGDCSAGKHGWDDCAKDRERAELKQTDYQMAGEQWWYAFSLYLPHSHRNIWPAKLSLAQFHQEGAGPVIMFQNDRGGLWLDIHDARRTIQKVQVLEAHALKGRWHDIVLRIKWSRKDDGMIDMWIGHRAVANYRGATMSAEQVYFKFGVYRSFLSRNARLAASTSHVAYFDSVRRGKTRREVELPPE